MLKKFFTFLLTILCCGYAMADNSEYVDLGLPSKTLWATCNLGATTSTEYGDMYAWGETATKNNFTWSNYVYCNGTAATVQNIGSEISGTKYDAAKAKLGDDWRMPTEAQFKELLNNCRFSTVTIDGVNGKKITGPNGNYIFLPFSGYMYDGYTGGKGTETYYWSGTIYSNQQRVYTLHIKSGTTDISNTARRTGVFIRPVFIGTPTGTTPVDEEESSAAVDLGLSVKWAPRNLGATKSTEYGDMYAWGETTTKNNFTWSNYLYGTANTVQNIGSEISGTEYDAAKAKLGDKWRMPTKEEIEELLSKCTITAATVDGVKGQKITGPNGKSIFLPFSGYMYDGYTGGKGTETYYWSGTIYTNQQRVYTLHIKAGSGDVANTARRTGVFIRPVYAEAPVSEPEAPTTVIDLGLSVKWSTCNLGATKSTEYGDMFAWGETKTKNNFTWSNYLYGTANTVQNIGSEISDTEYDAAKAILGDDWRMPTKEEIEELLSKCTITAATIDGVKGQKITGPNGNSIFLPFSGYMYDGYTGGKGTETYYWSGTIYTNQQRAYTLHIKAGSGDVANTARRTGVFIRPVYSPGENTTEPTEPLPGPIDEIWNSDAVDLGLSVKWSTCNFGAETETELGDMYAWGETATKDDFTWGNYIYCNGTAASVQSIGSDITNTENDAVAALQSACDGDIWRMPTKAEIQELQTKCTFTAKALGGVNGVEVKGPNGNTIFLPYGGYKYDGTFGGKGTETYYWSGTIYTNQQRAYTLHIKAGNADISNTARRTGVYIRPVCGEGSGTVSPPPSGNGPGPKLPDPYFGSNQSSFDTDGIESLGAEAATSTAIYSLSGMKVDADNLKPGVYVRNGKKFVVK